jgi:hypothetical protein
MGYLHILRSIWGTAVLVGFVMAGGLTVGCGPTANDEAERMATIESIRDRINSLCDSEGEYSKTVVLPAWREALAHQQSDAWHKAKLFLAIVFVDSEQMIVLYVDPQACVTGVELHGAFGQYTLKESLLASSLASSELRMVHASGYQHFSLVKGFCLANATCDTGLPQSVIGEYVEVYLLSEGEQIQPSIPVLFLRKASLPTVDRISGDGCGGREM